MSTSSFKTPGVYINEVNAFPNSIVAVDTAISAFVGYTARASYKGKSYLKIPVKIESLQEFMIYFGRTREDGTLLPENEQYTPVYHLRSAKDANDVKKTPADADFTIGSNPYQVDPDKDTVYYLYNSIKLFYANGGGTCYIVSVGGFAPTPTDSQPIARGEPLVNPNIRVNELVAGLQTLEQELDPTMILIPDAMLLSSDDCRTLNDEVLKQCSTLKTRVALIDVPGGMKPDSLEWEKSIGEFRDRIGTKGLNYAAAYFPFLKTTVVAASDIDFRRVHRPSLANLAELKQDAALWALLDSKGTEEQIENALRSGSKAYQHFHEVLLEKINLLPPSPAMAGIYTVVDNEKGVWHAPANISLAATTDTTLKIAGIMQDRLNVDPSGKSINAIRFFPGKGILVWGARTLDGNSDDWRYINVRRTLIMIEESMKRGAFDYVFAPNDANTWSLVKSMLNNFLTNLWREGALVGATPAEAFSVQVGLGTTMTGQDILDGYMRISVKVAVSQPAEFIVITIQQQMQTS